MSTNTAPWELDRISVSHPTDRPNFSIVRIGPVEIGFSYRTAIHVSGPAGTATRQNSWGPTTGRHLNWFGSDKDARVNAETFAAVLGDNLATLGLSLLDAGVPA